MVFTLDEGFNNEDGDNNKNQQNLLSKIYL